MGEREPGRRLGVRDPHAAADLCRPLRVGHIPKKWTPAFREGYALLKNIRACPDSNGTGRALAQFRFKLHYLSVRSRASGNPGPLVPIPQPVVLGPRFRGDERRKGRELASLKQALPRSVVLAVIAAIALTAAPAAADPIEDFNKGKTATIVSS